ncbi:unnamed protein product [Staurois parvus]|uniref:Uncharacterized protein n=1 Tax=Staurois parvus TaxID=386267 RepID=A0ABN9EKS4_9NEOB|nr:unnamed protein product [Staurois parvus]
MNPRSQCLLMLYFLGIPKRQSKVKTPMLLLVKCRKFVASMWDGLGEEQKQVY